LPASCDSTALADDAAELPVEALADDALLLVAAPDWLLAAVMVVG